MNITTQKIKAKGYSLPEFLKVVGFSLSTYRRYEKDSSPFNSMLNRLISELKENNIEQV